MEAESGADATRDLRDFQRVGQACAWCIAVAGADDLGFVGEAPQRCGVEDAGAVAGKGVAGVGLGRGLCAFCGFGGAASDVCGVIGCLLYTSDAADDCSIV